MPPYTARLAGQLLDPAVSTSQTKPLPKRSKGGPICVPYFVMLPGYVFSVKRYGSFTGKRIYLSKEEIFTHKLNYKQSTGKILTGISAHSAVVANQQRIRHDSKFEKATKKHISTTNNIDKSVKKPEKKMWLSFNKKESSASKPPLSIEPTPKKKDPPPRPSSPSQASLKPISAQQATANLISLLSHLLTADPNLLQFARDVDGYPIADITLLRHGECIVLLTEKEESLVRLKGWGFGTKWAQVCHQQTRGSLSLRKHFSKQKTKNPDHKGLLDDLSSTYSTASWVECLRTRIGMEEKEKKEARGRIRRKQHTIWEDITSGNAQYSSSSPSIYSGPALLSSSVKSDPSLAPVHSTTYDRVSISVAEEERGKAQRKEEDPNPFVHDYHELSAFERCFGGILSSQTLENDSSQVFSHGLCVLSQHGLLTSSRQVNMCINDTIVQKMINEKRKLRLQEDIKTEHDGISGHIGMIKEEEISLPSTDNLYSSNLGGIQTNADISITTGKRRFSSFPSSSSSSSSSHVKQRMPKSYLSSLIGGHVGLCSHPLFEPGTFGSSREEEQDMDDASSGATVKDEGMPPIVEQGNQSQAPQAPQAQQPQLSQQNNVSSSSSYYPKDTRSLTQTQSAHVKSVLTRRAEMRELLISGINKERERKKNESGIGVTIGVKIVSSDDSGKRIREERTSTRRSLRIRDEKMVTTHSQPPKKHGKAGSKKNKKDIGKKGGSGSSKSSGSNNINKKKPPLPSSHGSTSSSHHTSSSSSSKPTSTDVTNAHGKSEVSSSTVPSDFAPASFTSNGMSSLLDQDPHASPMFQSFSNPDLPLGGSVLDSGSHGLMLPPPSNSTLGSSGHKLSLSPPSLPSHSHRCLSLPASPHHHHIHSKQPLIHSAHDSQVKIVMDGFISVPSSRHPSPEPSSSLLLGDIRGEHGLLASTSTGSFGSF
ncbi:hypothetical protein ADUPG1_013509, partial [Aduncisulcus paluster]